MWKFFFLFFLSFFCIQSYALDQIKQPFQVAAVEFNPIFMELDKNIEAIQNIAEQVAQKGSKLIVFPEMATCGYVYKDRAQVEPYLDTIPGKTTHALEQITQKYGVYIAIGIGEKDPASGMGYNTAALIGPEGYMGKYRKVGLNSTDQLWVSPGNLGHPVFETKLGLLGMVICYDDIYFQTSRLPSLKGADLIAYIVSSDRSLPDETSAIDNHSTIANVQYISAWNGVYVICADRSNTEANPQTGAVIHFNGASSIWDSHGNKIAQLPYTSVSTPDTDPPKVLTATVDPEKYNNPMKALFAYRRPELYGDLTLYKAPTDPNASKESVNIRALVLQYTPVIGNMEPNTTQLDKLIAKKMVLLSEIHQTAPNLLLFPAYSLTGYSKQASIMQPLAQTEDGPIVSYFIAKAAEYDCHIVCSFLEKEGNHFYHTALLIDNHGKIIGRYRQTHLDAEQKKWMSAGNELPVFSSSLGRIGFMLDSEVLFPEISGVLAVNRADLICIPSQYHGQFEAKPILIDPKLFIRPFPKNTMVYWYSTAMCAQAYVLVANFVGGDEKFQGSSGLYSLNPVMGHYPPRLATATQEEAFYFSFHTIGESTWWMNQQKLITGRRADLAVPMTLPMRSEAFLKWKESPGWDESGWANHSP